MRIKCKRLNCENEKMEKCRYDLCEECISEFTKELEKKRIRFPRLHLAVMLYRFLFAPKGEKRDEADDIPIKELLFKRETKRPRTNKKIN